MAPQPPDDSSPVMSSSTIVSQDDDKPSNPDDDCATNAPIDSRLLVSFDILQRLHNEVIQAKKELETLRSEKDESIVQLQKQFVNAQVQLEEMKSSEDGPVLVQQRMMVLLDVQQNLHNRMIAAENAIRLAKAEHEEHSQMLQRQVLFTQIENERLRDEIQTLQRDLIAAYTEVSHWKGNNKVAAVEDAGDKLDCLLDIQQKMHNLVHEKDAEMEKLEQQKDQEVKHVKAILVQALVGKRTVVNDSVETSTCETNPNASTDQSPDDELERSLSSQQAQAQGKEVEDIPLENNDTPQDHSIICTENLVRLEDKEIISRSSWGSFSTSSLVYLVGALLIATIIATFAITLAMVRPDLMSMDGICAPVQPGAVISAATVFSEYSHEGPWWATTSTTWWDDVTSKVCAGRPRTSVRWISGELKITLSHDQCQRVQSWKGVQEVRFGSRDITLLRKKGSAQIVDAPWKEEALAPLLERGCKP